MNRTTTLLVLALAAARIASAETDLSIAFSECFLKYNAKNGETEIILYNIRPSRRTKLSEDIFKDAFGLSEFEINDLMVNQAENSAPAIRVLAQAKNFMMNTPVEQLFSNVLKTKVTADLEMSFPQMKMNVTLPMQDRMYVADNNALQVLQSDEQTNILMQFDISTDPLEVVIGWEEKETLSEKMDRGYQHDADLFRLRHLLYYGELIEEYHQKTGKYPLQGKSAYQNYVHIAAPHQQKYTEGGPPYKHDRTDIEAFRKELEAGLGRKVALKFDPQKVPVDVPNFYIYMVEGDSFFLAVHLYNRQSFSNPVARHYNKVELTNEKPDRSGLWQLNTLKKDDAFRKALNKTPHKEDYFLHLEEQYN